MSAPPLLGDLRAGIPMWALRPGAADCLRDAARGMPVWLLIRSSNGLEMTPCYLSEQSMAETLWYRGRGPIRTHLKKLRQVPGLLLEIALGRRPGEHRFLPSARFATDPARVDYWRSEIANRRLPALARKFSRGVEWLNDAHELLALHSRASEVLLERLKVECFDMERGSLDPWSAEIQDAGGGGRDSAIDSNRRGHAGPTEIVRPRRRKRRRKRRDVVPDHGKGESERAAMVFRGGDHA
jgi:hypothetical protein